MNVGFACSNCHKNEPVLMGVRTRFDSCSVCGVTIYCSKDCQKAHWKSVHKAECSINKKQIGRRIRSAESSAVSKILLRALCQIADQRFTKDWYKMARNFMRTNKGHKGVMSVLFQSIEEAEYALSTGIRPGQGSHVKWFGMPRPEVLDRVCKYDPKIEFVFNIEINGVGNLSDIFHRNGGSGPNSFVTFPKDGFLVSTNPFDPRFPNKKVILDRNVVIGSSTNGEARRRWAAYVRDCIRALGLHTPKEIIQRLKSYVDDNFGYGNNLTHNGTMFIFYCPPIDNITGVMTTPLLDNDMIAVLNGNYKRAVILM